MSLDIVLKSPEKICDDLLTESRDDAEKAHVIAAFIAGERRGQERDERRPRNLRFTLDTGMLTVDIGVDPIRITDMNATINAMIQKGATLRDIITELNEAGRFNDAEWSCLMFALGAYAEKAGKS